MGELPARFGGHPVDMGSANGRYGPPPHLPQLRFELSASISVHGMDLDDRVHDLAQRATP